MDNLTVVSNSGPLISLSSIHQLDLLRHLFGKVCIPEAVYHEVVTVGGSRPGSCGVRNAEWIRKRSVEMPITAAMLLDKLDPGETETIFLAIEMKADYVLLDEQLARRKAFRIGLPVIGTLGILLLAKKSGHIDSVSFLLDELEKSCFRMSRKVRQEILIKAGEGYTIH